jgi:hypothetical protein
VGEGDPDSAGLQGLLPEQLAKILVTALGYPA